jgi:hypothetical protein
MDKYRETEVVTVSTQPLLEVITLKYKVCKITVQK